MEMAGFRGGRRRRSNSGRLGFATASVLRWPTSSDESRKRKRRSRRTSGEAHRKRSCTGATGIPAAAEGHGGWLGQARAAAFQRSSGAGKRRVGFDAAQASSWRGQLRPAGNAAGESALDTNCDTGGARLGAARRDGLELGRQVGAEARACARLEASAFIGHRAARLVCGARTPSGRPAAARAGRACGRGGRA
jgi:hypothetical protein